MKRSDFQSPLNAIVGKQLLDSGVELQTGENIRYVIVEHNAKAKNDRACTLEHLDSSDEEIASGGMMTLSDLITAPPAILSATCQTPSRTLPRPCPSR